MENGKKKGSITSMVISKAGKIAGDYSLKPEPAAPALMGMNKPLSWLHLRKSSTKTREPEIKRVNSEKRISFSEEGGGELGKGGGRRGGAIVEGRRSVSHVETNLASVITFLQVKVMAVDMPGFMQVHAFRCARRTYDSLERFSSKHIAYNMKKEFDKVYGPAWHCIVGASFGSFVTHATGCFLYFSMEKLYILLFKTKVQRALD